MPRFLNERATTAATSASHPGRMASSASSTVTLDPRSESSEANSQPMAPPPTTATVGGTRSRSRNSSEVSTRRPSTSNPGSERGTEPAASTTWRPTSSVPASSPSTTRTRRPGRSVPVPDTTVIRLPLSSPLRPLNSWSTTACLRAWLTAKSTVGAPGPASMPNSAAPLTVR